MTAPFKLGWPTPRGLIKLRPLVAAALQIDPVALTTLSAVFDHRPLTTPGLMFWLRQKTFAGSYLFFNSTSRS